MGRGLIVVVACALALAGCGTMVRGTDEQVGFETVPEGATVRAVVIDNRITDGDGYTEAPRNMACVTPCVLTVRRPDKMDVTVTKPGFQPETFTMRPQLLGVATGMVGNAIIGGVGGAMVDLATGADMDKCPKPVRITLRAEKAGRGPGFDPVQACKAQTDAQIKAADPGLMRQSPPI